MVKKLPANLLQIKVQLNEFSPSNYRTFLLSEDDNFLDLHIYIQKTFGFDDYHLWSFVNNGVFEIAPKDDDFGIYGETKDPKKTKLKDIFIKQGIQKLDYEYDFGDSWGFDVTCQKVIPYDEKLKFPKLIKSKGGMLLEDCGGIWGLSDLIENYNNKTFDKYMFESWEEFEEYMAPVFENLNIDDFEL